MFEFLCKKKFHQEKFKLDYPWWMRSTYMQSYSFKLRAIYKNANLALWFQQKRVNTHIVLKLSIKRMHSGQNSRRKDNVHCACAQWKKGWCGIACVILVKQKSFQRYLSTKTWCLYAVKAWAASHLLVVSMTTHSHKSFNGTTQNSTSSYCFSIEYFARQKFSIVYN